MPHLLPARGIVPVATATLSSLPEPLPVTRRVAPGHGLELRASLLSCCLVLLLAVLLASSPAWAAQPAPTPTSTPGPPITLGPPPTPTTTVPPSTAPPGSGGFRDRLRDTLPFPFGNGPGFPDIAARIRDAVNGWFRDLVASSLGPLLDMVARTILATPDLTAAQSRVRELWWVAAGIANTALCCW